MFVVAIVVEDVIFRIFQIMYILITLRKTISPMISVGVAMVTTPNHVDDFRSQFWVYVQKKQAHTSSEMMLCSAHHPKHIHVFSELWKNKLISWKRCWWHWHLWACLFGVLDYNFNDGHGLSNLSYLPIYNVFIYRPSLSVSPKMGIPLNRPFFSGFSHRNHLLWGTPMVEHPSHPLRRSLKWWMTL